jgi:electron transfer flavoprotein beta subunit
LATSRRAQGVLRASRQAETPALATAGISAVILMNIIVCIKRVAATDSKIAVGPDGTSIDPAGVEFVVNPFDEIAVEQALKTKEAAGGDASVTVITFGTGDAQKELRTCLAMGADKAVLLKSDGQNHDAHTTAEVLATYIKTIPHDIIFCGKQAVDNDNSQVPPRLAALLDVACVTEVKSLVLEANVFTAERDIEGGREIVRCPMPAVLSTQKGLNEPRYASLKGIMAAKRKPLDEVEVDIPRAGIRIEALTLPPKRQAGKILGEGADAVSALVDALRNEAKVL